MKDDDPCPNVTFLVPRRFQEAQRHRMGELKDELIALIAALPTCRPPPEPPDALEDRAKPAEDQEFALLKAEIRELIEALPTVAKER